MSGVPEGRGGGREGRGKRERGGRGREGKRGRSKVGKKGKEGGRQEEREWK